MQISSANPRFKDINAILDQIKDILISGRLILGEHTAKFETEFSKYIHTKHAIAASSATAGLEMVLRHWYVKDKEVIIPTNTFIACANATVFAGGTPVFCDINPETYCMSANDVLDKLTPNTKAIMAVHLAGLPVPDIREIKKICKERDICLLEDCSHAPGAMINGIKVGAIGDAAVFSLYPTKIITTCVGGMITTNNEGLSDYIKSYRHHGQGKNLKNIINFGNDWLMDEIRAILGIHQLKELENNIKRRNKIVEIYTDSIEDLRDVNHIKPPSNIRHSYYRYLINLDEKFDKERVIQYMNKEGIEVETLYATPLHLQPIYKALGQKCPVAEQALRHQFGLPVHMGLNDDNIEQVINTLRNAIGGA